MKIGDRVKYEHRGNPEYHNERGVVAAFDHEYGDDLVVHIQFDNEYLNKVLSQYSRVWHNRLVVVNGFVEHKILKHKMV